MKKCVFIVLEELVQVFKMHSNQQTPLKGELPFKKVNDFLTNVSNFFRIKTSFKKGVKG